jgi:hypothetical protein
LVDLNFAATLRLLDSLALIKEVRRKKTTWSSLIEGVEETLLQLHGAEAYLLQGKAFGYLTRTQSLTCASTL